MGGKLDNAADSTKTRLKKRWDDAAPNARVPGSAERATCTGTTKEVPWDAGKGRSESWFNSCRTDTFIMRYDACSYGMGILAGALGVELGTVPAILGITCYGLKYLIQKAQNASDVRAVKYYITRIKWNPDRNAYDEDMTILPQ